MLNPEQQTDSLGKQAAECACLRDGLGEGCHERCEPMLGHVGISSYSMQPCRSSEWLRVLLVLDLSSRSMPTLSPTVPDKVSSAMANALTSRSRTRPQRWQDAVAGLIALQAEYAASADALPEGLRDTATAEALRAIVDLDIDTLADIEPSRGYRGN